ncbi:MAG TPA: cyclic nucleotide-binding domain-containing protein, partial [Gemmatimonadaceae bacterium]|nr:cyclic nucleotide-binding domain-containing protein [Gemmatimonadaceae bacterium]
RVGGDAPPLRRSRLMSLVAESSGMGGVPPELFTAFPTFADFTLDELRALIGTTRRWELKPGTLLFAEGSEGGSCFIVAQGAVDVSLEVNGAQQRLARLGQGSMFGQVSLVTGEPRSATCTAATDCVLLELERDAAERLLGDASPMALKLLGVLNEGLIAALRGADRRAMELEQGEGAGWSG